MSTGEWNWRVQPNPSKPAGWQVWWWVWRAKKLLVGLLDGSLNKPNSFSGWNPDQLLTVTLAILCNVLSSVSLFISESFSVFIISNAGSSLANIPLFAWRNCLITTFSQRFLPVVFDCLQRITSFPRETLASTPTPCGMIEDMSCATIERSVYCECISSC